LNEKKQAEYFIINRFKEHCPDFPKGLLKPSESPDFILDVTPRQKIGIELTILHKYCDDCDLLSYENLVACLDAKNDKLPLYRRKKLNEYWLVISVNDLHSWDRTNLHNKLIVWGFKTGFNRVFLFNTIREKIIELNRG
jgi:hypothetical protein